VVKLDNTKMYARRFGIYSTSSMDPRASALTVAAFCRAETRIIGSPSVKEQFPWRNWVCNSFVSETLFRTTDFQLQGSLRACGQLKAKRVSCGK
jgi:hypothetical protein